MVGDMLVQTVRSLLELHPAGLSNEQLLWRLRSAGIRFSAADILQSLEVLIENGEVAMAEPGRWRLAAFRRAAAVTTPGPATTRERKASAQAKLMLSAVTAVIAKPPSQGQSPSAPEPAEGKRADADWKALLRYYAATQRQDPRGRVDERADQHSVSWQLFRADGRWWDVGELRAPLDALPDTFREALMKRPEAVCSVGYPVAFFIQSEVPAFVPALLLPAAYRITASHLIVEVTESEPVINPLWLEMAVSRSRWQKEALVEALLPEGETGDLADITNRLRNGLATMGGTLLRPAQLAGELTLGEEGLRNAAGFFLPSDDRFTRGAERDLEAMQAWPEELIRQTALGHLFAARSTDAPVTVVPAGPMPLTDRQHAAAAAALRGPLTLIQGPPGTGKSAVILGLLTSIVLSGRSVLLASKNHQALDEVEGRLAELVDSEPILTRGRDSDGERNTNFLSQMRALADGETMADGAAAADPVPAVLDRARSFDERSKHAAHRTALHVQLSEAAEQLDRWKEALPDLVLGRRSRWSAILTRIRRLFRRGGGTEAATPDRLARLVERLRRELADAPVEPEATEWDDLANALAVDVRAAVRACAGQRTTPTKSEAVALAERLKELEFNSRVRMPPLTAEDARRVLRHRPVWAISTLSVSSRVPLVAGLFDYVIFDEASQCDIASALPLLARARYAVVVGDPKQLSFIPQLSRRQEHALMDAAGLGMVGRHSVAQSNNSLFAFVRQRDTAHWHFLADQFRSAPDIVAYLNEEFYEGQLLSGQDLLRARTPEGYKPGLAWHDVPGRATREDGGSVNHAEADAVVTVLAEMIRVRGFTGSIGVLSPFNSQVGLLIRRIRAVLTEPEQALVNLRVSTIDKFQGGEADVILFSLVVADGVHAATLGFYERDRRRVNVAISRARALCLIIGDKAFVRRSGIGLLARLAERAERPAKPRQTFDSEWERRLFEAMHRRGLDPIPQYPVAGRYLDFALDPGGRRLDVEVDGRRWHANPDGNRKLSDRLRDRALIALGWKVRRFWVHELAANMEECLDVIERDLAGR